jgi:hypothetical protein
VRKRPDRLTSAKELRDRLAPLLAVVLRQLVHVHRHEAVGDRSVDPAAELEGVLERVRTVVERTTDRIPQDLAHVVEHVCTQVPPRGVHAERKRQAGLEQPPLAEIEHLDESVALERQLALVNEQPGERSTRRDLLRNLLERELAVLEVAEHEAESEECSRESTGHHDLALDERLVREGAARDDDRPVAGADARAVRHQHVVVLHEGVGRKRERRHLEPPGACPLVERLDVRQNLLALEPAGVDAVRRERPEHERVVGVGTVTYADPHETGPR